MSLMLAGRAPASDAELLRRVRTGDADAFGLLYARHVGGARVLARSLLRRSCDVDDAVAEAFAGSFAAITRGKGPVDAFGTYLLSSVRNECYRTWRKSGHRQTVAEPASLEHHPDATDGELDDYARLDEHDVLHEAFDTLPTPMRVVLWHTEVEGASHADVARMTGSTTQAVATLAMRARRALSTSYLQAHLSGLAPADGSAACRDARQHLASIVRGSVGKRRRRTTTAHVADCPSCTRDRESLDAVNQRLRTVPLGALLAGFTLRRAVRAGIRAKALAWVGGSVGPILAVTGMAVVGVTTPSTSQAARQPTEAPATPVATDRSDPGAPVIVTPFVPEVFPDERRSTEPPAPAAPVEDAAVTPLEMVGVPPGAAPPIDPGADLATTAMEPLGTLVVPDVVPGRAPPVTVPALVPPLPDVPPVDRPSLGGPDGAVAETGPLDAPPPPVVASAVGPATVMDVVLAAGALPGS